MSNKDYGNYVEEMALGYKDGYHAASACSVDDIATDYGDDVPHGYIRGLKDGLRAGFSETVRHSEHLEREIDRMSADPIWTTQQYRLLTERPAAFDPSHGWAWVDGINSPKWLRWTGVSWRYSSSPGSSDELEVSSKKVCWIIKPGTKQGSEKGNAT
jgi:hypothetical protein